ncbi:hypothetical protein AAMO2058_000532300 [Amorphochlora amoebiformis]
MARLSPELLELDELARLILKEATNVLETPIQTPILRESGGEGVGLSDTGEHSRNILRLLNDLHSPSPPPEDNVDDILAKWRRDRSLQKILGEEPKILGEDSKNIPKISRSHLPEISINPEDLPEISKTPGNLPEISKGRPDLGEILKKPENIPEILKNPGNLGEEREEKRDSEEYSSKGEIVEDEKGPVEDIATNEKNSSLSPPETEYNKHHDTASPLSPPSPPNFIARPPVPTSGKKQVEVESGGGNFSPQEEEKGEDGEVEWDVVSSISSEEEGENKINDNSLPFPPPLSPPNYLPSPKLKNQLPPLPPAPKSKTLLPTHPPTPEETPGDCSEISENTSRSLENGQKPARSPEICEERRKISEISGEFQGPRPLSALDRVLLAARRNVEVDMKQRFSGTSSQPQTKFHTLSLPLPVPSHQRGNYGEIVQNVRSFRVGVPLPEGQRGGWRDLPQMISRSTPNDEQNSYAINVTKIGRDPAIRRLMKKVFKIQGELERLKTR